MQQLVLPYDGLVKVYDASEGIDIIINELKSSTTVTKGKGKNAVTYSSSVAAFDIETTKLLNLNWSPKIAEQYHYFNITFCWQFMINDKFIFGRYIEEYFDMMRKVSEVINHIKLCVFIHNINYEFGNLRDFFLRDDPEIFYKSRSTPLFIRQNVAEYRCSRQLTHKSLAQLGKDINYEKLKDDFDYSKQRSVKTELSLAELNYCYRDVKILCKWIANETANYCKGKRGTTPAHLPYTQTGYVRNDIKKAFSYTYAGKRILENVALPINTYLTVRRAFWGGYTHANFRIIGRALTDEMLHVDIKSAYPWALITQLFPYTLSIDPEPDEELYIRNLERDNFAQIAELTLYNVWLKEGHIPYIPYSKGSKKQYSESAISENGKLVGADSITLTLSEVDMRLILRNYDIESITIHKLYTGIKRPLPYAVVDAIIKYFEGKSTLKDVEDKLYEYGLSKQLLNGIYGLAATDCMFDVWEQDGLDVKSVDVEYRPSKVLPYQWAIYTTAYVRNVIYGMITSIVEEGGSSTDFWYSDTDSVFCRKTALIVNYINEYNKKRIEELTELKKLYFNIIPLSPKGKPQYLGTLELEDDDCVEFCTIGAKRYYIKHSDGTYDITFSGLRATKRVKVNGEYQNGYNTQRLIDMYGDLNKAFNKIKDDAVYLPYVEGVDKLSNYNVIAPFKGELDGDIYIRPCSYTLYPQATNLSLNFDLFEFLNNEIIYNEVC